MKRLFSPLFIVLFVAVPQIAALGYAAAVINASNVEPDSRMLPMLAMLAASLFFTAYAYTKRKEEIIGIKILIAISVLYSFSIFWNILYGPAFSGMSASASPKLITIAASIVSVIYGIMGIAYHTTTPGKTYDIARYIVGIFFTPFIWFLAINLLHGVNSDAVMLMLIIASAYALVLFTGKLLFICYRNRAPLSLDAVPKKRYYIAVAVTALCMPLLGLSLNQFFKGPVNASDVSAGLFGDFSHPAFYIIAALNGLLLLVPPVKSERLRLFLFYLKSAGYTYILYFFIVFIPVLPLGFVGIALYGLGLLALTPLFVTILQGYHLFKEWKLLSKAWGRLIVTVVLCAGMITLPFSMAAVFWGDKANLAVAVQYLESKDFHNAEPVDLSRLKRTLDNAKDSLRTPRGILGISNSSTPIISALYNKMILDGKTLSQYNVQTFENLFFDAEYDLRTEQLSNPELVNNSVRLMETVSETKFDEKIGVYRSRINLKLKNPIGADNGEYITVFKLPEGAYISDYYLDVSGTRKQGLLTDSRAALFIYSKIVNTRRDPGLLHYIGKNTLELRVFPFAANETRETGFEILHSQKFDLDLDGKTISLGGDDEQKEVKLDGAVLLTAEQKSALKPVKREPEYYFVVDSSKNSDVPWLISQAQAYAKANGIRDAAVIFASYKLKEQPLSDIEQAEYTKEGGFNLNLAISRILSREDVNRFPIIIAVSDNMTTAVLPRNIVPLARKFPESQYYYSLNHNLTVTPYSYEDNRADYTITEPVITPVLDYNGIYVMDNHENELVLTDVTADKYDLTGNQYEDAIQLDALQQKKILSGSTDSVELVRASFRAKILTSLTAFIVVETQEQENELLSLQERILNNNEPIPTVTLDEPNLIICIILLLMTGFMIKWRKNQTVS